MQGLPGEWHDGDERLQLDISRRIVQHICTTMVWILVTGAKSEANILRKTKLRCRKNYPEIAERTRASHVQAS